ncbi:hypothetical protein [Haladaptatus sp. ZSTT2]|uniref:hypothetical protein n=1 Tax=Haladaptatus sp. ZSTT2 TaxID=3120515 RepID=UPI00300F1F96
MNTEYPVLDSLEDYADEANADGKEYDALADRLEDVILQWEALEAEPRNAFMNAVFGIKVEAATATKLTDYEHMVGSLEVALADPVREAATQALNELCGTLSLSLTKDNRHTIDKNLKTMEADQLQEATATYSTCEESLRNSPEIVRECTREYVNEASASRVSKLLEYEQLSTQVSELVEWYDTMCALESAFDDVEWAPAAASGISETYSYYKGFNANSSEADAVQLHVETIEQKLMSIPTVIHAAAAVRESLAGAFQGSIAELESAIGAVASKLGGISVPHSALAGAPSLESFNEELLAESEQQSLVLATDGLPFRDVVEAYLVGTAVDETRTVDQLGAELSTLADTYDEWVEQTYARLSQHKKAVETVSEQLTEAPAFHESEPVDMGSVADNPVSALDQLKAFAEWVTTLQAARGDYEDDAVGVVETWLRFEMGEPLSLRRLQSDGLTDEFLELVGDITFQKEGKLGNV